ncbi:hypothetical protein [Helicobacter canis]|uniref:Uncharacterized protein n=1 Tax=Helicobacter canis TaxID=29419 RepID=A0A377J6H9_9HELI|nr:hypothetical protein [Helicobacter canis]STO97436.1 Uncharacterised protein [Helicobacter canis]
MEVNWKNVGLGIAGLGGLGYLAYKYYNAKEEEKEEYAFKRAQRAKKRAKEEAKQELLQERLIEEIEAPFARYCADMGGFSFGAGFLELRDKLEQASQESGKVDSSDGETLSSSQAEGFADEASSDTNAGGRIGEKVDSSTAETLSELAQDSRICDEKSGLSSDWQGIYLSGNDRRQSRRIHDLSRKAESTRNAKLSQKMREINAYIESFSPTQDELLKVLSLGQEMFDHISKAKPFAQFTQASKSSGETTQEAESEQNTPSDMAKELISLYAAVITSLSGDKEQIVWGGGCIFPIIPSPIYDKLSDTKWRHQWLFNTGLTLPLQVCMMKHLQSVFGIEPANFTIALSKLAKDAAYKYRIIGLDKEAQPSPASFFGFFNVPTHQSPESPLSGVYGHILRDIGREYSRLLVESNGDKAKLESSIEAWDSAALTL